MGNKMSHSKSAFSEYWIFTAGTSSKFWGRAGENMSLGYDIFRELSDGKPLWITQAASLEEAQEKLEILARTVPANYFIRDASSAKIIARAARESSQEKES